MAYKQPGFGSGEKASLVHSSPLNISRRKRMREAREKEGRVDDRSGVTISRNQYAGKTNKQIKKLKERAAKKAAKADERAASGKKLSKRQRDAIAERDYNIKRESEKSKAVDQRAKNLEIYAKPPGVKTREQLDQKAMEQDYQEQQVADAEASANAYRDPALVASEKRDPAEQNIADVDVVEKREEKFKYGGNRSSGIRNPDHKGPTGGDYTNQQIEDMNRENFDKYDEYGVTKHYRKGKKGWEEQYGYKKGAGDAGRQKMMEDYPKMFGSDAQFPTKDDGTPDYMTGYRNLKGLS